MPWISQACRYARRIVAVLALSATLGACGVGPVASPPGVTKLHTSATGTDTDSATTAVTGQPILNPPTTDVSYPNPYRPAYDTLQSLVNDSLFIFTATIEPETTLGGQKQYPLNVVQVYSYSNPQMFTSIFPTEVSAARLIVGDEYLFFYGGDEVNNSTCIVGGVRGVFIVNTKAKTITRLSTNSSSLIPKYQSIKSFLASLSQAVKRTGSREIRNGPPVCESSATGL